MASRNHSHFSSANAFEAGPSDRRHQRDQLDLKDPEVCTERTFPAPGGNVVGDVGLSGCFKLTSSAIGTAGRLFPRGAIATRRLQNESSSHYHYSKAWKERRLAQRGVRAEWPSTNGANRLVADCGHEGAGRNLFSENPSFGSFRETVVAGSVILVLTAGLLP